MQRIRAGKIWVVVSGLTDLLPSVAEQLIQNQLYCDGRGSEDGGPAVESKRHGMGFRGIRGGW